MHQKKKRKKKITEQVFSEIYLIVKENYEYKHDDASLGFGLAGLIAGVLESPEGAALGALFASGAELPVSRYHLAVQSANYEKASDENKYIINSFKLCKE